MKQLKKLVLLCAFVAVTCLFAACGNADNNADTNGTEMQEDDLATVTPGADNDTNNAAGATENVRQTEEADNNGTDSNGTDNNGAAGNAIDDVGNGIEEGVDGVIDGAEDIGNGLTDGDDTAVQDNAGGAGTNP